MPRRDGPREDHRGGRPYDRPYQGPGFAGAAQHWPEQRSYDNYRSGGYPQPAVDYRGGGDRGGYDRRGIKLVVEFVVGRDSNFRNAPICDVCAPLLNRIFRQL
jgi:hypothetical protein